MLPADNIARGRARAPEIVRVSVLSTQEAKAGTLSGGTPLMRIRAEVRVLEVIRSVAGLCADQVITVDHDVPIGEFTFESLGYSYRRLNQGETVVLFAGQTRYGTYAPIGGGYGIVSNWHLGETWPSRSGKWDAPHPLLDPTAKLVVLLGDV